MLATGYTERGLNTLNCTTTRPGVFARISYTSRILTVTLNACTALRTNKQQQQKDSDELSSQDLVHHVRELPPSVRRVGYWS